MKSPRLRDSRKAISSELYHLNEIPDEIVTMIGGYFIYLLHVGRKDITGNDWGDAFARAIGGNHLESPLGIADVVKDRMAWSLKTVKSTDPFKAKRIRLISGRCSPDFSYGIADPHKDIQQTGTAVLGIWNERVNIAYDHYNPVRTAILIRSNSLDKFCLFEEENHRYRTSDYKWEENSNGNLIGRNIETGKVCFTWQPHGSQFTIHEEVPMHAVKFTIKHHEIMTPESILQALDFDSSWVKIER